MAYRGFWFGLLVSFLFFQAQAADIIDYSGSLPAAGASMQKLIIHNTSETKEITVSEIEKLPLHQTKLRAVWGLEGTFTGVMLTDLLNAGGLGTADPVGLWALDNYNIVLSKAAMAAHPPFFATRIDGHAIPLAKGGPYVLLFPDQEQEAIAGKATTADWIWGISEIGLRK